MAFNILSKPPILQTLRYYKPKMLRYDILAGTTVAAVAIPQSMAYAQLAGAPTIAGLYAALAGMIIFATFSTTRSVIVGPDAALAALTGATLLPYADGNNLHYMTLVVLLTILIGIAFLIAATARLSFISEFLSRPILLGYLAGLALSVIALQAPKLFGLSAVSNDNFFSSVMHIISNISHIHVTTALLSLLLGLTAWGLYLYTPRFPTSLVILAGSIIISQVLQLRFKGVDLISSIPSGLPRIGLPSFRMIEIRNLVLPSIAIMMVGYADTIATARSFASKEKSSINPTQELTALGFANLASGIVGGVPVIASGSKTAVNRQTGSTSQVSQLIGAFVIAMVLLFLAPIFRLLPSSALAVIIILAVIRLFDYKELRSIWHAWRSEAALAIITMLGVTVFGIFQGLLLAVVLAVLNLIRISVFPADAVLGLTKDGLIGDKGHAPKTEAIPGIIMYRFDAPLYFGNADFFRQRVLQLLDADPTAKWFLWDAETITNIDSTAGAMLFNLLPEIKERGVTFCIARMKRPIIHTINQTNRLSRIIKHTPQFPSIGEALDFYKAQNTRPVVPGKN